MRWDRLSKTIFSANIGRVGFPRGNLRGNLGFWLEVCIAGQIPKR